MKIDKEPYQGMPIDLADDLLEGAAKISKYVFGCSGKKARRKIYYLAQKCRFPVFRLGSVLCARKSVVLGWIKGQEERALPPKD